MKAHRNPLILTLAVAFFTVACNENSDSVQDGGVNPPDMTMLVDMASFSDLASPPDLTPTTIFSAIANTHRIETGAGNDVEEKNALNFSAKGEAFGHIKIGVKMEINGGMHPLFLKLLDSKGVVQYGNTINEVVTGVWYYFDFPTTFEVSDGGSVDIQEACSMRPDSKTGSIRISYTAEAMGNFSGRRVSLPEFTGSTLTIP